MRTFVLFFLMVEVTMAWNAKDFKKPSEPVLKQKLTAIQFKVTQHEGTEPPFKNEYWDNHAEGIYVDVVSGEPLFSSTHKYESGTGWPSFYETIKPNVVSLKSDRTLLFQERTEVRSKIADSHLGHVFDDGPAPTHKRYCMNSASLKFIAKDDLEKQGYGEFLFLFAQSKHKKIVFAGGCFWCMEPPFEKLDGVVSVLAGYSGGDEKNAKYELVSAGGTGHLEVVQVSYDESKIDFNSLLDIFFKNIDPFDGDGQFCDKGESYKTAVFVNSTEERKAVEDKIKKVSEAKKEFGKVATRIENFKAFYPAEEYHQDYYKKNPIRYKFYRTNCGRDKRLKEIGL